MAKQKIELTPQTNVDAILDKIAWKFRDLDINTIDGLKISWIDKWVHLRKSDTEPIISIYTEAKTEKLANELAQQIIDIVKGMTN